MLTQKRLYYKSSESLSRKISKLLVGRNGTGNNLGRIDLVTHIGFSESRALQGCGFCVGIMACISGENKENSTMKFDTLLKRFALFCIFFAVATMALVAQTNAPGPIDDAAATTFFQHFSKWQLLLIPIVTVVVAAVKKWIPLIPTQLLPWIAPFIGVGLDYFGSHLGLWSGNVAAGAAMGGLATWFNEFLSQTKELKEEVSAPATPSNG